MNHTQSLTQTVSACSADELCAQLLQHCQHIYQLLGNRFQRDCYLWTLSRELDCMGYSYQLCGRQKEPELYPDTIKITVSETTAEVFLVVHAQSAGLDNAPATRQRKKRHGQVLCLAVYFGSSEFRYRLI